MQLINYRGVALKTLISIIFFSLIAFGCEQKTKVSSEARAMEKEEDKQVQQDNLAVDKDTGAYTYMIQPEDMVYPVVQAEEIDGKEKTSKGTDTAMDTKSDEPDERSAELAPIHIRVSSSKADLTTNRPPIYDSDCLNSDYPVRCSSDKIRYYIRENLDFPENALKRGHDGIEVVTFKVTKDGEIKDLNVDPKEVPCSGCKDAVMEVVSSMPENWSPALVDGKAVTTEIKLPIHLKTI